MIPFTNDSVKNTQIIFLLFKTPFPFFSYSLHCHPALTIQTVSIFSLFIADANKKNHKKPHGFCCFRFDKSLLSMLTRCMLTSFSMVYAERRKWNTVVIKLFDITTWDIEIIKIHSISNQFHDTKHSLTLNLYGIPFNIYFCYCCLISNCSLKECDIALDVSRPKHFLHLCIVNLCIF